MKFIPYLLLIGLVGCVRTINVPESTANKAAATHKVWLSEDYVLWQDYNGFGCGDVTRSQNG